MGSSTIFLLFLLTFISSPSLFPFHQTKTIMASADQNLIEKTCRNTLYYKLCVSSLRSDPTSLSADTKGLALIMAAIGKANATATSSYLSSQILSSSGGGGVRNWTNTKEGVVKECAEKYRYAADAIEASIKDLNYSESYDYAYMHISAAADYANACRNAFGRYANNAAAAALPYPPKLARRETALKRICAVILGIIDLLGW